MKSAFIAVVALTVLTSWSALASECVGEKYDPTFIDQQICSADMGFPHQDLVSPRQVAVVSVPDTWPVKYASTAMRDMAEQAYIAYRFEAMPSRTE
jgi:hypothetical protein